MAASPGAVVTIVGERLGEPQPPAPLRFGVTLQPSVESHSDERWVVRVPASAASGPLALRSTTGMALSPAPFAVGPASPLSTVVWAVETPTLPHAAAASPDGSKLYVARSSTVDVFDTARIRVLASLVTSGLVHALVASPDGRAVYSATAGRVDTMDAMRLRPTGSITMSTGEARAYLAVSPDGSTMLVSAPPAPSPIDRFSRITLVRLLDKTEMGSLSYRDNPVFGGVAFSPDGTRAYLVADTGAKGVLWRFDAAAGPTPVALNAPINLPRHPTHLGVSPDGTTLFIGHDGAQTLSRVDLLTERVESVSLGAVAVGLAYTRNGEQVFVATRTGVVVLRADSGEIVAGPIAVPGEPRAIVLDPRGEMAYVLYAEPNGIAAIGSARVATAPAYR